MATPSASSSVPPGTPEAQKKKTEEVPQRAAMSEILSSKMPEVLSSPEAARNTEKLKTIQSPKAFRAI